MSAATYLAHAIEYEFARQRVNLNGFRYLGRNAREAKRLAIAAEFDPHAATELAALIEKRMRG